MKNGKPRMYCPRCQSIQICKTFPLTEIGDKDGQNKVSPEYSDLNWFHRARECVSCKGIFETAEIDENKLYELIRLRNELSSIICSVNDFEVGASVSDQLNSFLIFLQDLKKLPISW